MEATLFLWAQAPYGIRLGALSHDVEQHHAARQMGSAQGFQILELTRAT